MTRRDDVDRFSRGRVPMLRSFCIPVLILLGCGSAQESAPVKMDSPKWPRSYEESGDRAVVYEPQIDGGWKNHQNLHARSAVVVTPKGGKDDAYGVLAYDVE